MMTEKTAIIIGAGPAGLTAAYELAHRTSIHPIVFESTDIVGGLACTRAHEGNRIDMGGHRFFSKSQRVMRWWNNILPLQRRSEPDHRGVELAYQGNRHTLSAAADGPDPSTEDRVMLIRRRLSRILFLRQLFDYPLSLNAQTIRQLGLWRTCRIGSSYARAVLFPIREEATLEDFLINRFGRQLYLTFFKSYTEKVWGVPCDRISAEWGAQRIKGLSVRKAIRHALRRTRTDSVRQEGTETSLIEWFLYPKYGPGQMWEETARRIHERGGEIHLRHQVVALHHDRNRVVAADVRNHADGTVTTYSGDCFFSTMPVRHLIRCLQPGPPDEVKEVAQGLVYRDFMIVGLLLEKLKIDNDTAVRTRNNLIPDNWIYVQEPDAVMGRIQIFNNWSPYLVRDPDTVWLGIEYFVNAGQGLWCKPDDEVIALAVRELNGMGWIERDKVRSAVVLRVPKAYPAYFGTYDRFEVIRRYTDRLENLFLVGRNGMHRYNNQDHSMLTAMVAVDNIMNAVTTKDNIWNVNVDQDYHEEADA